MCVKLCASLHLRACMQQNNGLLSAALITREPALEKEVVVDAAVASVAVKILAHLVILPCCWVEPLSGMMQHCKTLIYASRHKHQHECVCLRGYACALCSSVCLHGLEILVSICLFQCREITSVDIACSRPPRLRREFCWDAAYQSLLLYMTVQTGELNALLPPSFLLP